MAGMSAVSPEAVYRPAEQTKARLWTGNVGRFVRAKPLGAASALVILLLVLVALLAGVLAPYDPVINNTASQLQGPGAQHLLGTDQYGRDVFSRIVYGARTSLYIGVGATLLGVISALFIGTLSAYFGGVFDYLVQRLVDTVQAIPSLILLIAILVILGPSRTNVIIALAARSSMVTSRVVRGSALAVLGQPYVDASRVLGCGHWRVILRHIVPNIMAPVIILATINFGGAILAEAALSFLGYGVPPPTPTWGSMLSAEGRAYMFVAPWLLIAPTAALTAVVFSANMLGDALRDVLDPRLRLS
ncbi:MAG: ABC transporter permease [Dehalococcoidia bacterium]